ncbi:MAG: sulfotransferase [Verrucomicrobiae bacterium]|nr:sulfotransferase [Verrucomicrobiae bacterium]
MEQELATLSELLNPLEKQLLAKKEQSALPIFFIMGCARSGTTLIFQYLSRSGIFCYPTNFLSRFFFAPTVGGRLQRMLFDYDLRNELGEAVKNSDFSSALGKTSGILSPNEFWYFWRRFFDFPDQQVIPEQQLAAIDVETFISELSSFQALYDMPFLAKGGICNWHIPFLSQISPRIHFIFVYRDTASNASSLVAARESFFGDSTSWYSFKPPGYKDVISEPPIIQTQWQVAETNRAISEGLQMVSSSRQISISYEEFCDKPRAFVESACDLFNLPTPNSLFELPERFPRRGGSDT